MKKKNLLGKILPTRGGGGVGGGLSVKIIPQPNAAAGLALVKATNEN
jgi:hypothetical protein